MNKQVQSWFQAGFDYHKKGNFKEAQHYYRLIIQENTKHFDALHLLGVSYYQQNQYQQAIEWILKAIQIYATHPSAWNNLGVAYQSLHQHQEAYDAFIEAIKLKNDYPEAMNNIGSSAFFIGKPQESFDWFAKALALRPNFPDVYNNRSLVLQDLRRHHDAIQNLQMACQLRPDYAEAYNNLGVSYHAINRYQEALTCYKKSLAIQANYPEAYNNLGNTLKDLGQFPEALQAFEQALKLSPSHPDAHWNKSLALLALGEYQQGFELYEWRWKRQSKQKQVRHFAQALWLGQADLKDKTILLYAEQGLGDTIQFCRYTAWVAALGAKIILEAPIQLMDILQSIPHIHQFIALGDPLPNFDYQCPLLSLPLAFKQFSQDRIFAPNAYLSATPHAQTKWKNWLPSSQCPKIGLVWRGSLIHLNDHNRSMALEQFQSLLMQNYQWCALQKEWLETEKNWIQQQSYTLLQPQLETFSDTAALCEQLDLILSVDTSVAHLAAAIGKPVWLILPFNPDWRWLLEQNHTPWYPNMRLFRQKQIGEWQSVVNNIQQALKEHFS